MRVSITDAQFDRLAARIADGSASTAEREEFISSAQIDREILGRLRDWIDRSVRQEAQIAILKGYPKRAKTFPACGACGGSGRMQSASEGGVMTWDWPCQRCKGSGVVPQRH